MARRENLTKKKMINAIIGSGGIISVIAQRAGCKYCTVFDKIEKYPELRDYIEKEKEKVLDVAESELIKKIKTGDNTAMLFYLKTKGKHRGYVERTEQQVEVKEMPPLKINMGK